MVEVFQNNPSEAIDLLNEVLADEDQGELLIVLRWMTKAFGSAQEVAPK